MHDLSNQPMLNALRGNLEQSLGMVDAEEILNDKNSFDVSMKSEYNSVQQRTYDTSLL